MYYLSSKGKKYEIKPLTNSNSVAQEPEGSSPHSQQPAIGHINYRLIKNYE
jgi:hypothetical protein